MDPLSPSIAEVIDFLVELFDANIGYSDLSTARSALSNIIKIDNNPVGEHPLVVRFMKGVFNERPALPKNTVTWNPQIVLDYFAGLKETSDLTLKELSLKCAVLLWLLSGQRGHTIHMISIKNISLSNEEVKLRIGDPLKTTRPGFHQKEITLKAFTNNEKLCVVRTVKEYLERTATYREGENQMFLSFQKPHKKISRDTMSRWIREVMGKAGLDTSIYTPHSLRSASTSSARSRNVPINTILETAGWKKDNTFRKFYSKEISNAGLFGETLQANTNSATS